MFNKPIYYGWWIALLAMVVNALISGPVYGGAGLWVDSLESEFGWSRTQLSIAFSIGQLEGSLAAPMVGFLIDKFGGKKMIMVGAVFAACGFLIILFIP